MRRPTAREIEQLLPQTQCRQCGFADCRAYAAALAQGTAEINRCAPGGAAGIARLAQALGRRPLPLDPEYGRETPFAVARIEPRHCIGCGRCVHFCPVDAVTGARKRLHAVLEEHCTGCALCVPVCPMDCIRFVPAGRDWTPEDAAKARERYARHRARREEDLGGVLARPTAQEKAEISAAVAARMEELRNRIFRL